MASKETIICLLRNDLRLHDNEVLQWANQNADNVIPVYCFDPRNYETTENFHLPKTNPNRLKFQLESVRDVRKSLQNAGSGLIVRKGKPEEIVPEIINGIGKGNIKAVVFHEEATSRELTVESALAKVCGVPVKKFWGSTLYHQDDLPFSIKQLPDDFREFHKSIETKSKVRSTIHPMEKMKPLHGGLEHGELPTMKDFGFKDPKIDPRSAFHFEGGESSALARLHYYLWESDCVAKYKEMHTGVNLPDNSTKFSAWLALGCISPRKIFEEIHKYENERTSNESTHGVINELLWRDYFKFIALKYGDRLFELSGLSGKKIEWKHDDKLYSAWKEGKTGVPFIDACMRELASTSFTSNEGRQDVASFLTKDLKLDWRLGAEWFEHSLIDHDYASNYGNWVYSAGVGNDPDQDMKLNVVERGSDHDPQGDYIRLWVPELAGIKNGDVHTPWNLSSATLSHAGVTLGDTYPTPVVMAPEWK
ncbi:cryptochrome DASH-like [Glandiceps talaboti]